MAAQYDSAVYAASFTLKSSLTIASSVDDLIAVRFLHTWGVTSVGGVPSDWTLLDSHDAAADSYRLFAHPVSSGATLTFSPSVRYAVHSVFYSGATVPTSASFTFVTNAATATTPAHVAPGAAGFSCVAHADFDIPELDEPSGWTALPATDLFAFAAGRDNINGSLGPVTWSTVGGTTPFDYYGATVIIPNRDGWYIGCCL